ncbi:Inner membrane protein YrbG [Caenispirillum salinarum AK4]|uniref:Inner membrane protein YrbG n=1 Tax=Caenispirillum salinarum AK4 TaxID=1238182 RepID=K9GT86_9PROT|nr:calcium/sodium antiporter [Caenispirillum salinarum]EKV29170.1 Inner membrane protein YrbG [Caenispirillum salinarum AK4]
MLYLSLIGGLVLLLVGGDVLVRGAVAVARKAGVSPLVIGLTLVGFGTSLPELVTSLQAAMMGSPAIAVGNVVGSNIANILLILGASALVVPVVCAIPGVRRDLLVMTLATAAAIGLVMLGAVPRWAGVVLIVALLGYTGLALVLDRRESATRALREGEVDAAEHLPPAKLGVIGGIVLTVLGIAGVILGARLLVGAAVELAQAAGISEAVIGVTLVAVGTSLPELATSLVAAVRRQGDVALGNVVGSNVFNILGILGVTAAVSPIAVPEEIASRDIWVMAAATLALLAVALVGKRILNRMGGLLFLAAYAAYTAWLILA